MLVCRKRPAEEGRGMEREGWGREWERMRESSPLLLGLGLAWGHNIQNKKNTSCIYMHVVHVVCDHCHKSMQLQTVLFRLVGPHQCSEV